MSEEVLRSKVETYFETYGLPMAVEGMRSYDEAIEQTRIALVNLLIEQHRAEEGWQRVSRQRREFVEAQVTTLMARQGPAMTQAYLGRQAFGLAGGPEAPPTAGEQMWQTFDVGFQKVRLMTGAMSNLVHMYYWAENAVLQLDNAQNRLANAQDRYNRAVETYGLNSWQAIQAYRMMQVSENRLERAHNRQILNWGLLGTQMVMMVGRLAEVAKAFTITTTTTDVQTASNWRLVASQIGIALTNPIVLAALIAGGTALGLAYFHQQAIRASEREEERRIEGVPEFQRGGVALERGIYGMERGEIVLNAEQQAALGIEAGGGDLQIGGARGGEMLGRMIEFGPTVGTAGGLLHRTGGGGLITTGITPGATDGYWRGLEETWDLMEKGIFPAEGGGGVGAVSPSGQVGGRGVAMGGGRSDFFAEAGAMQTMRSLVQGTGFSLGGGGGVARMGGAGGTTIIIQLGNKTFVVNAQEAEGVVDGVLSRDRWDLKSELRRFIR